MNWFQANITEEEVKANPHIGFLNQTEELAEAIQAFSKTKDIILTPRNLQGAAQLQRART